MSLSIQPVDQQSTLLKKSLRPTTRRVLVVVNPHATTVSDQLRSLAIYALRSRYQIEAIDTQAKQHATEIAKQAAQEEYDAIVVFGGDGTVNEVANGLVGSDTALACLPGGSTSVYARMIGMPNDLVAATKRLLKLADNWNPRKVDLGVVNGRYFAFCSGVGLDASVVERVDKHPHLKASLGPYYFIYCAARMFFGRYLRKPPQLGIEIGDKELKGVSMVIQNGEVFTYYKNHELILTDHTTIEDGTLAGIILKRINPLDQAGLARRVLIPSSRLAGHRQVDGFSGVKSFKVKTLDGKPFPVHVDGDFIGNHLEANYSVSPKALTIIS